MQESKLLIFLILVFGFMAIASGSFDAAENGFMNILHSGNYFTQRENVDGVIKSRNFFRNYLAQFYYLMILFLSVCHHLLFLHSFEHIQMI